MRRTVEAILLFLSVLSTAFGAENPEDRAMAAIRPDAIRGHMRFLADDLLEGRGTGTRGYAMAALYIATQFEALGLEPGGVNGGYFQPIRFRSALIVPEESSLKLIHEKAQDSMIFGEDYTVSGDPDNSASSFTAQVIYIGYGVSAPEFGVDDYAGIDVRGKVVAILRGAGSKLPATVRSHYSSGATKRAIAAAHGALGTIQVWDAAAESQMPFSSSVKQFRLPVLRWLPPGAGDTVRQTVPAIAVLSEKGTQKLFANSPTPLNDVIRATQAGISKSLLLPTSIMVRTTSRHSELTSSNVAGIRRGSDPQLRDEYVVYSAHADHLGIGEPVKGDSIYNGAMDNASGVAGMIEVARAFSAMSQPPRRSVLFLAVTGEEKGLLGSDYFAEYPTVPRSKIVANINIDGMGMFFDFSNVIAYGGEHSTLGELASRTAGRMGLSVSPDPAPAQNLFIRSDQYSFIRRGIPAIYIAAGSKAVDPSVNTLKAAMQLYRYHVPGDDMSLPLNYEAGAKHARLEFLLGYTVAQEQSRPRWNEGDFFSRFAPMIVDDKSPKAPGR